MKIVLVFPPFLLESMYNLPPLGLINLATILEGSGHDITLLDFVLAIRQQSLRMGKHIYDDCADRVVEENPDVVGFSVQCTTYPAALNIAKRIRKRIGNVKIVFGGHNAGFVDTVTLERFGFVDCIVRGEGEKTFAELIEAYATGKGEAGVKGVTFRKDGKIIRNPDRPLIDDLDTLPLPNYSYAPCFDEYRKACNLPRSIVILEIGRGCPHRCIYCSESIMWRRKTRTFSVDRVVKEMIHLRDAFGAECFLLAYDQFTANRAYVERFCQRLIEEGLNKLPWYCISRLDTVDSDLLALMREAGCESMCYGIDSGSKRTLSFIHKKIDEGILYQRVGETAEAGIIPTLSFVIGFPEEERNDIDETLTLALQCGIIGNNNPLVQMPTVLPGTELHKKYLNTLVREVDTYFALGLEFEQGQRLAEDEALIDSDPALFSSFYNIPCKAMDLKSLNLITQFFPLMVQLYPKTFLLLSKEVDRSVSQLFLEWLKWLAQKKSQTRISLTPRDCYLHFPGFVSQSLATKETIRYAHLSDVLHYETLALDAGKFPSEVQRNDFHIDLNHISSLNPVLSGKIVVGEFAFYMPDIILDLKAGRLVDSYPRGRCFLAFRVTNGQLDVFEINSFGKDLLELCDGKKTIEEIASILFTEHGQGVTNKEFLCLCLEAHVTLGQMGCIDIVPRK